MKGIHMNRISILFLRAAVLAIGAGVLALCIFALPAMWQAVDQEHKDITYALYGILTAFYVAAVPFFIGLYQAWRLLNLISKSRAFSRPAVKAFRRIAYCAVVISAVLASSLPFFYVWAQDEDAPGLVVIGMFFVGASLTVSVFATLLERLFSDAVDIKSENDLTV
jgi:Protein of unknown function (DUF3036).